jgi:hypothetical protein
MKIRMILEGTAPLLCHNIRLADPFDPIVRAIKEISGKRKKTDEDLQRMERLEFEGGLYLDENGPTMPGASIEKCLVEGARVTKQGKQVERGLIVTEMEIPLQYDGPRDVEGLWDDPQFRSRLSRARRLPAPLRSVRRHCRPALMHRITVRLGRAPPGMADQAGLGMP